MNTRTLCTAEQRWQALCRRDVLVDLLCAKRSPAGLITAAVPFFRGSSHGTFMTWRRSRWLKKAQHDIQEAAVALQTMCEQDVAGKFA